MRFLRWMSALLCRAVLIASFCMLAFGLLPLLEPYPALLLVPVGLLALSRMSRRRSGGWQHGTAAWADTQTLARNDLFSGDGLILGRDGYADRPARLRAVLGLFSPFTRSDVAVRRFFEAFSSSRRLRSRLIRIKRFVHLGTFAPAGKGKGVSCLIPNLLSYRGSCVCTDPKGELATLTAGHRVRKLRHRCVVLDPCHVTQARSARLNPLTFIDTEAADFLDQCRDLANMLVVRTGNEHDPHWNDAAELVLTAFIAFVCACEKSPQSRSLQTVRKLVSSPAAFEHAVSIMQQVGGFGGVIERLGHQLAWFQDRERSSVLTTVQRHTAFLDSPAIQENTAESSFDPRELRSGRVTVYLVLPPERLVTLAPLMRMWLGTILRVLTRGEVSEASPVLFLLDEAAHLGKIQILEDAVTLMRGYGIRLWFFFQSIDQLSKCYGERAATILDNLSVQQHFGFSSYSHAEEASRRIGDTTVRVVSTTDTISRSHPTGFTSQPTPGSYSCTSGHSVSQIGRRLIKPEELMTMDDDAQIIFANNLLPIAARLVRYHSDPEFRGSGTGRQRGTAFADGLKAACLLLCSGLIAAGAYSVAQSAASQRAAVDPAVRPMVDFSGRNFTSPPPYWQPMPVVSPPPPSPFAGQSGMRSGPSAYAPSASGGRVGPAGISRRKGSSNGR